MSNLILANESKNKKKRGAKNIATYTPAFFNRSSPDDYYDVTGLGCSIAQLIK